MLSLSLSISSTQSNSEGRGPLCSSSIYADCWWGHRLKKQCRYLNDLPLVMITMAVSCPRDDILYSVLFFNIPWPFGAINLITINLVKNRGRSIGLREEWLLLSEQAVSRCSYTHRHMLHPALKIAQVSLPRNRSACQNLWVQRISNRRVLAPN